MNYVCKEAGWYDVGNGEPKKVAYTDAEVLDYIKANDSDGYEDLMVEVAGKVCEGRDIIREMLNGRFHATYETLTPYALDYIGERMYVDTGALELMFCEVGDEIEGD